jgi:hypothetical protein
LRRQVAVAAVLGIGLATGPLVAQQDTTGRSKLADARAATAVVTTSVATGTLRLDGRLDESVWTTADSIVEFRQREPEEGVVASERTVVRVARDADALYIAIRAFDSNPQGLKASQLRRDAELSGDDNVRLLIDGFHDRRSGFVFATNPNGAMWDAQISGLDNTNENWNGIWNVTVSRDSLGWTAEFRIPFRTLRFDASADASFGFNVRRFIQRRNEEDLWQSWGRTQGFYQLLNEGELTGLGQLTRARNVELRPYALARAIATEHDVTGARLGAAHADGKVGLDTKIAVAPTVTADLTVNTDFAQVEADRQVVNLTRFPLFFPEKREFFLESSGIFAFGTESRAQPFYTRRIGLDAGGRPVPILGGARLYGKSGPWTFGALDVRTGGVDAANDAVVRVKHDLLDRAFVGALFTNRAGPGVTGAQRTGGLDVDLPLVVRGRNVEPSFWITGTQTPGVRGTPLAWRYGTDYPNDLLDNFFSLYRIDSGFAPALGFVRRTGIWETTGHVDYMPRPHILGIRQLDIKAPVPSWDIVADRDGSPARVEDWQTAEFEWRFLGGSLQSGDLFEINLERLMDAPRETFEIFGGVPVAPGRYWWTRGELQYETSPRRPLSVGAVVSFGDFYDGRSTEVELQGSWRDGGHLIIGADLSRTTATLPNGRFTAVQAGGRLEYAVSTRADFLAFVQYNNEDQRADFNLRFHWIPTIGDDLFVVWNSGFTTDPLAPNRFPSRRVLGTPLNGALVIKAVHRFGL